MKSCANPAGGNSVCSNGRTDGHGESCSPYSFVNAPNGRRCMHTHARTQHVGLYTPTAGHVLPSNVKLLAVRGFVLQGGGEGSGSVDSRPDVSRFFHL
jgi:hypothetical protein